MKTIELKLKEHETKIGETCKHQEPNIKEDCYFTEGGKIIGLYLTKINDDCIKLVDIANDQFISKAVPKTMMSRGPQGSKEDKERRIKEGKVLVEQYSTILGGMPPKPHMRRNYANVSSVHNVPSAKIFIKAMLMLLDKTTEMLKQYMPEQYELQYELCKTILPKYRLNELYTSSISNANIAAAYHKDNANVIGSVNLIITKRLNSEGGCLHLPDYGATIEQKDNSLLVYPAWKNIHGVTPIIKHHPLGYRNSFVFYSLKGLLNTL